MLALEKQIEDGDFADRERFTDYEIRHDDLGSRVLQGVSPAMLERMRLFFQRYPQPGDRFSVPRIDKTLP